MTYAPLGFGIELPEVSKGDTHSIADASCSTSLLSDEARADHLLGELLGLLGATKC